MGTTETETDQNQADETDVDVDADANANASTGEGEQKPTPEQLQEKLDQAEEELARARRALKKANREAASRRVALKNQKAPASKNEDEEEEAENPLAAENARLKEEIKQRDHRAFVEKEKARVHAAAAALGFKHPEDALALGGLEFDDSEPLDEEEIKTTVKTLARKRPELIQEKDIIDTDSQRRGKSDSLPIDEEDIARQFGVRNFVPSKKE